MLTVVIAFFLVALVMSFGRIARRNDAPHESELSQFVNGGNESRRFAAIDPLAGPRSGAHSTVSAANTLGNDK